MSRITVLAVVVSVVCYAGITVFPPPAWASECGGFGAAFNHAGPMTTDEDSCIWNQVEIVATGQAGWDCCPMLNGCLFDNLTIVDNSATTTELVGETCVLTLTARVVVDEGHTSLIVWKFLQPLTQSTIDVNHEFICP